MFLKILNLRRFSAIWLLIATIAIGIVPQNQSYAQSPVGCPSSSTWSHTLNFRTASQSQWLLTNSMDGEWQSGVGWKAINYPNGGGGGGYDELRGSVIFSNWSNELDTVLYTYSYVRGDGTYYSDPRVFVNGLPIGAPVTAQGNNLLYLVKYNISSNMLFRARPDTFSIANGAKFEIHEVFICGRGDNPFDNPPAPIEGFDRPILAADNHPLQYWSQSWDDGSVPQAWCDKLSDPLFVAQYGECWETLVTDAGLDNTKAGRLSYKALPHLYTFPALDSGDVYSVGDGTVVNLAPLSAAECSRYLLGNNSTECTFEVPPYESGSDTTEFYSVASDLYLLQVKTGDDYLITYLLSEPTVEIGDEVGLNCILGRIPDATPRFLTGGLIETLGNGINYNTPYSTVGVGIAEPTITGAVFVGVELLETPETAIYPIFEDHQMWLVSWGGYPDPGLSCKLDPAFSGCVSVNPKFENEGEYWQNVSVVNPVEWRNPGVIIPPGGGVRLPDLVLDNVPYGLTFTAKTYSGTSPLSIKLGTTEWSETVSYSTGAFSRPPALVTPDDGLLTTLEFRNEGQNEILLDYACLHTEDARQGVSSCLLNNYAFGMGLAGWSLLGTSTATPRTSPGNADPDLVYSVVIPRDSTITQIISLYPNEDGTPHTYQVQITGLRRTDGAGIQLRINTTTVANYVFPSNTYSTSTFNFVVSSPLENVTLRITSTGDTADDEIQIAKICIPGPHPNQGGGGPPIDESCAISPTPTTTTVSEWIQWQWSQMWKFFNCQLMPLLASWFGDFRDMVYDFTDIGFFFMQTIHRAVNWFGAQFLPWLAGYLSNISPGTILINQQNGECAPWDIVCYVTQLLTPIVGPVAQFIADILGLFVQLLSFILSLLGALISLVFGVFNQFVELIGVSFQYVIGIGDAYVNAVPEPIDGLPACLTPDEHFICTGYWILENTILGGVGAAYIPIITGMGYVLLFISLFKRARGLVIKSADRI